MATQPVDAPPASVPGTNGNGTCRRILVVDDDAAVHKVFRRIFLPPARKEADRKGHFRFELEFASQGKEGWDLVKSAAACGRPYTVAFIDRMMPPGWDGMKTAAHILEADADVQVVLCTGQRGCRFDNLAAKLGRSDRFVILKKPFDSLEVKQLAIAFVEKWDLLRRCRESNHQLRESEQCHLFVADEMETRVAERTAELASTRRRLAHLLRSSPAVIYSLRITDPPRFTFVSDNFATLFGHSAARLLAEPGFWTAHLHAEDAARAPADRARLLEKTCHALDFRFLHRDGAYRWVHDDARVIRDRAGMPVEIIGSLSDITERKRIEEALRESEKRYRNLVENQGEGVAIVDAGLRFLFANPAAGELFRLPPAELIGWSVWDFVAPEDRERLRLEVVCRQAGSKSTYELGLIVADGSHRRVIVTATPQVDDEGKFCGSLAIFRDITERQQAEDRLRLQTTALEATANGIVITDRAGVIVWVNPAFTRLTGYTAAEATGKTPAVLKSGLHDRQFYAAMWRTIMSGQSWQGEMINRRKDGSHYFEEMTITPLVNSQGQIENFVAVKQDITERKEAESKQKAAELERQTMEVQLRQAQKLEAIGQLAAGIAHEINTPTQYVGDNTRFLKDSFAGLQKVLQSHQQLLAAAKNNALTPEVLGRAEDILAGGDLEYLFEQVPAAINETLEGIERVTKIVRAMKEFSHPGGKEKSPADLNKAIESTVTVARNEWKYMAEMKLDLDPDLPPVPCFLGEFNQVILNLVINAAHAIGNVVKENPAQKGLITVSTRCAGDVVEVRVSDTGTGIPEDIRPRIFEPFFTTKSVGKGTGQGLSIVYGSIVKKHGGAVTFETEMGRGTTFILRLPLTPRQ